MEWVPLHQFFSWGEVGLTGNAAKISWEHFPGRPSLGPVWPLQEKAAGTGFWIPCAGAASSQTPPRSQGGWYIVPGWAR